MTHRDDHLVERSGIQRIAAPMTLTEHVYDTLREDIISGVFHPGQRLVRRTLSQRLGVSPMPVVEALLRLEGDGLVESLPQRGCRVRALTYDDVRDDQVLREAIECQAARMCAENASHHELNTLMSKARLLDRLLPRLRQQKDEEMKPPTMFAKDVEFHMDVAQCGGGQRLAKELGRVWYRRMMLFSWLKLTLYKSLMENCHQKLVEAIASRDPDLAEAKMREHVRYTSEKDREALEYFLEKGWLPPQKEDEGR